MATLRQHEIELIAERPLGDRLDQVRGNLHYLNESNDPKAHDIDRLLGDLIALPAALDLQCLDESGSVAARLLGILRRVRNGAIQLSQFRPLAQHIANKSSDEAIWAAVLNVIHTIGPLTPPPSNLTKTFVGTPIKVNSNRLINSEISEVVEHELFFEMKNCTFRNVGGFYDKYFGSNGWRIEQKETLEKVMKAHNGERWANFPLVPDEHCVWDWFRSLEDRFLTDAQYKLYTTTTAYQFKEQKGQLDLFIHKKLTELDSTFEWKHVLVVGEHKKSHDTSRFKADYLQLARYVRLVFADQPTRRFVHAFTLCASTMELWVFDRSGAYSSGPFDIHNEPDKFARALIGYTTMDDEAMGVDTFIEQENGHRYVTLDDASGNEKRIKLNKAIIRQKAIVCRGTTCYKTEDRHVAKFSWASDKRKLEVEHLKLAKERGVRGVAKVVAHREITTIADMRHGLSFSKAHHFRSEKVLLVDPPSTAASTNALGLKRKSSYNNTPEKTSDSQRRQSNPRNLKLGQELNDQPPDAMMAKPSLYATREDLWENRIYSCLVVSPAGRVISDFRTARELLESMRDAIKAHRSLYVDGNILHRDISSNNIIITKPEAADGFKGMLIDLDLAKVRDSGPSGARHQTGTMQFMAVEVLRRVDHTYRHDLESFFYVLLWMCARQSWHNGFGFRKQQAQASVLQGWENGSFSMLARTKEGDMTVNGIREIITEIPTALEVVEPLCLRLRDILFPYAKDNSMSLATPAGDPDQLYNPIIEAYDQAIGGL